MEITKIFSAQLNPTAIQRGEISASKEVREHFNFLEGISTVGFEVGDQLGHSYALKAKKRRMEERYPKEVIAGLKTYIQEKGLVQGDRITISRVDKLFGAVLPPTQSCFIHYEKAAQGGANFAGAEAGEN
ncbi:hypothetical protein SLA2020_172700 [Shorea laevis]